MVGKGDKGLFITTGVFTKDAKAEACRDGATPIDLIDGEELATKLKDLPWGSRPQPSSRSQWTRNGSRRCSSGSVSPVTVSAPIISLTP